MREEELGFQLSQREWQGFLESVYVPSNILSVASR